MSLGEAIVVGTLNADGTLVLDQVPNVPPGRVEVTIKPNPSVPTSRPGLAEVISQIQRDQAVRGFVGLSTQEMAYEEKARQEDVDEYEQRCQDLWAQTESGTPEVGSGQDGLP